MACPQDIEAITDVGLKFAKKGSYEEAIKVYDKALKKDPNCFHTLTHKGYALLNLGKYKKAQECFMKALTINPNHRLASKGLELLRIKAIAS